MNEDSEQSDPMQTPFEEIPLRLLGSIIPTLLTRKFSRMHLETVGDVLQLAESDFAAIRGIGGHSIIAFAELLSQLKHNPERYREEYRRNLDLESSRGIARTASTPEKRSRKIFSPADYSEDESLLAVLPRLLDDFYQHGSPSKRNQRILRRTTGVDGEKNTLKEAGQQYGMTREAARQIRNQGIAILYKIMRGGAPISRTVWCHEQLLDRFRRFNQDIVQLSVITVANAIPLVSGTDGISGTGGSADISDTEQRYLDFLFICFGFTSYEDQSHRLYYKEPFFTIQHLRDVKGEVVAMMRKQVNPVTAEEVFSVVGLLIDNRLLRVNHIKDILTQLEEYEEIHWNGRDCHQLRFCRLFSLSEKAVRVLRESGRPMRIKKIAFELEQRYERCGQGHHITSAEVTAALSKSPDATPIGKLGIWTLKQWNVNHSTMEMLIRDILEAESAPLSFEEIMVRVSRLNPYVRQKSIRATIGRIKEFVHLTDGKIGLMRWGTGDGTLRPVKGREG